MKKQLPLLLVLALGLQGVAAAKSPVDDGAIFERTPLEVTSQDEPWGIGRRVPQAQAAWSPSAQTDAGLTGLAELEMAFWLCDYIATTRGVEATPIATCSAVYDELKTVKFSGDFGELLDWWKENKLSEHRKIAS